MSTATVAELQKLRKSTCSAEILLVSGNDDPNVAFANDRYVEENVPSGADPGQQLSHPNSEWDAVLVAYFDAHSRGSEYVMD